MTMEDSTNGDDEGDAHFAGPHASEAEKSPAGPRVHSPCSRSRGIWRFVLVINIIKFLKNTIQIDFCLISRYLWVSEGESSPLPQTVPK